MENVLKRPDPLGVDPVGAIVAIVAIVELLRNYCVKYCINYCANYCVNCCSISLNISNSRGALSAPPPPRMRGAVADVEGDVAAIDAIVGAIVDAIVCSLYTSPSHRD